MSEAFPKLAAEAMQLPKDERLRLAGILLEMSDSEADESGAEAAWEKEIRDRIRAIDEGRETGISYEEVIRSVDRLLES